MRFFVYVFPIRRYVIVVFLCFNILRSSGCCFCYFSVFMFGCMALTHIARIVEHLSCPAYNCCAPGPIRCLGLFVRVTTVCKCPQNEVNEPHEP